MKNIFLSVVIPCYNEEKNIRLGALRNVAYFLSKQKYNWEVNIVDDGSNDDSVILIQKFIKDQKNFTLIRKSH